ncbi:hypothetical protein [Mesorhizobium sp.]|uniref:hypothetical protein n=1 Tax=Mesorhizobium sp. TaxID=1871066 RepID=UPI001210D6AE|nr:hypothetical protein [Mesorhizobium sp.]TIO72334.1 MAG: hypothetical protein E5X75_33045 [Mesorhizobium sp.]
MTVDSSRAELGNSQPQYSPESAGTTAARSALASFSGRSDLVREFLVEPFGRHSAELCLILDVMRSQPVAGKWIAIMTRPYSEWCAARWSLDLPLRVVDLASARFHSRQEVERWVFKRRWQHLIGPLPIKEGGDDV